MKRYTITLPNDVQTVPQLAEFVDQVCEEAGFDMVTTMQMNLAIEEAVVNVMNYAYPGATGNVDIEAVIQSGPAPDSVPGTVIGSVPGGFPARGILTLTISDGGVPFDPTAKAEVDTTLSAEERNIGGLGIHLIRKIMDAISYERTNDRNILTLVKHLPPTT